MSIKRDVNGYKVFDLRGGVQLLWAEEDNVLFSRMQGSEMAITTDIDAEFDGIMEAWEHVVVERDQLRKELEEKDHQRKTLLRTMQEVHYDLRTRRFHGAGASVDTAIDLIDKWLAENKPLGQEGEGNQ